MTQSTAICFIIVISAIHIIMFWIIQKYTTYEGFTYVEWIVFLYSKRVKLQMAASRTILILWLSFQNDKSDQTNSDQKHHVTTTERPCNLSMQIY